MYTNSCSSYLLASNLSVCFFVLFALTSFEKGFRSSVLLCYIVWYIYIRCVSIHHICEMMYVSLAIFALVTSSATQRRRLALLAHKTRRLLRAKRHQELQIMLGIYMCVSCLRFPVFGWLLFYSVLKMRVNFVSRLLSDKSARPRWK